MIMSVKLKFKNRKIYTKEELETKLLFAKIINEERGISKEVQNIVSDVNEQLFQYYKIELLPSINYNYKLSYDVSEQFDINLFNKEYKLLTKWFFYKNKKIYNTYKNPKDEIYVFNNKEKLIIVTIIVIGNKIVFNAFTPKLVHEIKHCYQYQKFNIKDGQLLHKDNYYNRRNIEPTNTAEECFKTIIYLSSQREQEAYGEELYSELCELKPLNYYDVINKCNSYLAYKYLEKAITFFIENKESNDVQNILNRFNYKFDNFIKKAKKNSSLFLKRLGRAISLYEEEKYKLNEIYDYDIPFDDSIIQF